MELAAKPEALSPSSTGWMTPFFRRSPVQSWAPTMRSGPWPVGAWAMKSVLMSCDGFWTTSRVTPVVDWKVSPSALKAAMRVSSTQTVSEPVAAGADDEALASGEVVSAGVEAGVSEAPVAAGEDAVVPAPPQAASVSESPAAATARRLLRMWFLLLGSGPLRCELPDWDHRNAS